jgi:hypothetical protein
MHKESEKTSGMIAKKTSEMRVGGIPQGGEAMA